MRDGPQISHEKSLDLIRSITPTEVEVALHGIDDDKSPRLDIFNFFFF